MVDPRSAVKLCQECREASSEEFKRVLELKNSGVVVYKHEDQDTKISKKSLNYKGDVFLLHNTANRDVKRPEFIKELWQYKTKCSQCKIFVQRVRSLLNELAEVRSEQVVGVCRYCKHSNASSKCERCEYIVNKFFSHKMKQYEIQQKRFAAWLDKVKCLLQTVLAGETLCKHKLYKDTSTMELENLLQELKKPLSMREPEIGYFLPEDEKLSSLMTLSESRDLLEELITKLQLDIARQNLLSEESLNICPPKGGSCLCTHFIDKQNEDIKIEAQKTSEVLFQDQPEPKEVKQAKKEEERKRRPPKEISSNKVLSNEEIKVQKVKINNKSLKDKENIPPDNKKVKSSTKPIKEKERKFESRKEKQSGKEPQYPEEIKTPKTIKAKRTSSEEMMLKLIRERENARLGLKEKPKKEDTLMLPKIADLPDIKFKKEKYVLEEISSSTSILECASDQLVTPSEMIKGESIMPFDRHYKDENHDTEQALLYKITAMCADPLLAVVTPEATASSTSIIGANKNNQIEGLGSSKGIIKYELSNKEFIEKGWTQLPTKKIMRKMNIYKMLPAYPQFDWFKRHRHKEVMYFETGQKLADFDEEGRGKWYYKNGKVALEYKKAQDLHAGERYIVYSSGHDTDTGKSKPVTVLALFDLCGNGVVYDNYGNIRLKYNQSEGMIMDDKKGTTGRWKWHTLNDPPSLQTVFVDTHLKQDPCLEEVIRTQRDEKSETGGKIRNDNADMLALELENFVKEKTHKMLQKFKPFQFRVKALKINHQFSLRIFDQANIHLQYREGSTSLKLSLGMILISNEIVDTETAEMSQVATPYDRNPPRSQSMADIQNILNNAQILRRIKKEKAARLMNM